VDAQFHEAFCNLRVNTCRTADKYPDNASEVVMYRANNFFVISMPSFFARLLSFSPSLSFFSVFGFLAA
jgi:hypothetical protein